MDKRNNELDLSHAYTIKTTLDPNILTIRL